MDPRGATRDAAMGPALTMSEWERLPEDEPGEWADGHLVEEEVTDYLHEVVVGALIAVFSAWLEGRGGFVGGSEAKFATSARRGRKPDVSVFLPGGRVPPARGLLRVPPDIAVEVLSAGSADRRRDRVEKLNEYAAFGVRFYWLLDPDERSLQILELSPEGRYIHAVGAAAGVVDPVPGCPGLRLDLDALWAKVDRLGPEPGGEET